MKKSNLQHKVYNALSKHESTLLNTIDPIIVFSLATVRKLTGWKTSSITNTLTSLKKKKIITSIKKDHYVVTKKIPQNIFAIATTVIAPSYVSFWTAASHYGLTEQQVKTIQVISTKQHSKIKVGGFVIETTTYRPRKFFGYHNILNFPLAEKEKLIVDLLFKPEQGGGIQEIMKCLQAVWSEINQKQLLQYVLKFNNKSCSARLGYLIETLQLKSSILSKLQKNLPQGFVKLNPAKEKTNHYNKTWRVIVNDQ